MKWEDVCQNPFKTKAEKDAFWERIEKERSSVLEKQRAEEDAARQERFQRGEDTEKDRYQVLLKAQAAERAALVLKIEKECEEEALRLAKLKAAEANAIWEVETRKRLSQEPIPKRKKWN
jgi:hypothetical protein